MKSNKKKNRNIPYRIISMFFVICFVISSFMAATLAYAQSDQHRSGYLAYSTKDYAVHLQKYEINTKGEKTVNGVYNCEFFLYKINENGEETQIGNTSYRTDENGSIMVDGLPTGNYVFIETDTTYAYEYDTKDNEEITKYFFTIGESNKDQDVIYVLAYNKRRAADLKIQKTVKNYDESPLDEEQKNIEFEFKIIISDLLNKNDEEIYYDYIINEEKQGRLKSGDKITLKHGDNIVINNLPVGASYKIEETKKEKYSTTSSNSSGSIMRQGNTANFVNVFNANTADIIVEKHVINEVDSNKEFTFNITFSDEGSYEYIISGNEEKKGTIEGTCTLTLKNNEKVTFKNIPFGVNYTVEEKTEEGYISSVTEYKGTVYKKEIKLPFKNHKTTDTTDFGFLLVSKEIFGKEIDENKEFEFKVNFIGENIPEVLQYKINNEGEDIPFVNGSIILLKHGETAVFNNLPVNLQYIVEELDSENYLKVIDSIKGYIPEGEAIEQSSNASFINVKESVKLTVKKRLEGEYPKKDKNKEFEFTLIVDDKEHKFTLKDGEEKEFDVPLGSYYKVYEEDYYHDGYVRSNILNDNGYVENDSIEIIQVNTYIRYAVTEINGEKTWDISSNEHVIIPDSIKILVKNKYGIVAERVVTEKDNWKWSITVPKYEQDSDFLLEYEIKEEKIPGFKSSVSSFNITNKYEGIPLDFNIPIEKQILGDYSKKSEFKFELSSKGKTPMPDGSSNNKKIVSILGEGKVNFGNIIYTMPGEYNYTLKEIKGTDAEYTYDNVIYKIKVITKFKDDNVTLEKNVYYEKEINNKTFQLENIKESNPLVFSNIYTKGEKNKAIYTPIVEKVLTGDSVSKENAETFYFTLEPKGENNPVTKTETTEILGEGRAYFNKIKFSKSGTYEYTVKEKPGNAVGYTYDKSIYTLVVTVTEDANGKLTATGEYFKDNNKEPYETPVFINKYIYKPIGELLTIKGSKTWNHGTNPIDKQPKSITILIKNNEGSTIEKTITNKDSWSWEVQVERYNETGEEYKYHIEEVPVDGYNMSINGFNIINTHKSVQTKPIDPGISKETVVIKGKKTWDHRDNPKSNRPSSIVVNVCDGKIIKATQTIHESDNWEYTFTMPKFGGDGKEINYSIDELSVSGYGKYVSGNNLINTFGYKDGQTPTKTGQDSKLLLWIVIMGASLVMLTVTFIWGRRRKKNDEKHNIDDFDIII